MNTSVGKKWLATEKQEDYATFATFASEKSANLRSASERSAPTVCENEISKSPASNK